MSAFLFIKAKIHDPDEYAKYVVEVRELAAKWDSRYIVRRRPVEILEGSPDEWGDTVEIARSIRILSEAIWGRTMAGAIGQHLSSAICRSGSRPASISLQRK